MDVDEFEMSFLKMPKCHFSFYEMTLAEIPFAPFECVKGLPVRLISQKEMDIYFVETTDLQKVPSYSILLQQLLKPEEKNRASQYKHIPSKHQYEAGKLLQYLVMSYESGLLSSELNFSKNKYGKPVLRKEQKIGRIVDFNLSHSGSYVVMGVARNGRVGIDIEQIHHSSSYNEIVETTLSQNELEHYLSTPLSGRKEMFIRYWTLKEAFLKALGVGLTFSLQSIEFMFSSAEHDFNINTFYENKENVDLKKCHVGQFKLNSSILAWVLIG